MLVSDGIAKGGSSVQFDVFHSLADPSLRGERSGAGACYRRFFSQAQLAEALGAGMLWVAESHFSTQVQKRTSHPVIEAFDGEVGLNCDSFQLLHAVAERTRSIGLGTAIHNIVGGSGGPIASADRVNSLRFYNSQVWKRPRSLRIGVASGRFVYQNSPFGVTPRDELERAAWPWLVKVTFVEALEIFLRLVQGQELNSTQITRPTLREEEARVLLAEEQLRSLEAHLPYQPKPRWDFEVMQLVPRVEEGDDFRVVLGSSDPVAITTAVEHAEVDLFNLSFTPADKLEALHARMADAYADWTRDRLPRTVLVFIDETPTRAQERADRVLDAYIAAMSGTARVPDKQRLLDCALVGDPQQVLEQIRPGGKRGFHPDDRLMLWFEFNQQDGPDIERQMRLFFEQVAPHV